MFIFIISRISWVPQLAHSIENVGITESESAFLFILPSCPHHIYQKTRPGKIRCAVSCTCKRIVVLSKTTLDNELPYAIYKHQALFIVSFFHKILMKKPIIHHPGWPPSRDISIPSVRMRRDLQPMRAMDTAL